MVRACSCTIVTLRTCSTGKVIGSIIIVIIVVVVVIVSTKIAKSQKKIGI